MARLYRAQARIFDVTRAPILLGRMRLPHFLSPGDTVLEIGCGTGHNLRGLQTAVGPEGRVIGIECAPTMAARASRFADSTIEVIEGEYGATDHIREIGTLDAIVFSYSLSMIPHFAPVLRRASEDLKPGGQMIILDFASSRWAWISSWMHRFGVELGEARSTAARDIFKPKDFERWRAWGGLWENYLLVASRRE